MAGPPLARPTDAPPTAHRSTGAAAESTAPLAEPPPEPLLPAADLPRHVAIIMDGNGRWAVRQGLDRVKGHQVGARVVRTLVTECANLRRDMGGPDYLTLYSFSLENWKNCAMEEGMCRRHGKLTKWRSLWKTLLSGPLGQGDPEGCAPNAARKPKKAKLLEEIEAEYV